MLQECATFGTSGCIASALWTASRNRDRLRTNINRNPVRQTRERNRRHNGILCSRTLRGRFLATTHAGWALPLLSFLVAAVPIAVALVMLGVLRRPAWQASLAGLIAGLAIATAVWGMPIGIALNSVAAGMSLALVPVMWIVVN